MFGGQIQQKQQQRSTVDSRSVHMQWVCMWWWRPLFALPLHWVGPAAFHFRVSLTIELWVAVHHRGDSDQHLTSVSLHHQLQFPARLLNQLPSVAERQVFCYRAVNLTHGERNADQKQCSGISPVKLPHAFKVYCYGEIMIKLIWCFHKIKTWKKIIIFKIRYTTCEMYKTNHYTRSLNWATGAESVKTTKHKC